MLLSGRLFDGPHGAPTLEGQYVLKDIVLVGAALVIAAATSAADAWFAATFRPRHRHPRASDWKQIRSFER